MSLIAHAPVARLIAESRTLRFLCLGALLIGVPALAVIGYNSVYVFQQSIDPWVYTGLIADYDQIVERFGPTYYAARIVHIFPAIWLNALVGDVLAFHIYQYLRLLLAAGALFALGTGLYSWRIGVLGAALICFSPALLLGLSDDMYQGTATVYLATAYVLALYPADRRRIRLQLAAGVVFALAASVYQLVGPIFVTLGPAWLFLHYRRGRARELALMALAGAAGFLICYFAIQQLLPLTNPVWANGNPTLRVIRQLVGGGSAVWHQPLARVFEMERYYAFAPLIMAMFLAPLLVLRGGRLQRPRFAWACLLMCACMIGFYLFFHAIGGNALINQHQIIYVVPATVITALVLFSETLQWAAPRWRDALAIVFAGALAVLWIFAPASWLRAYDNAVEATSFMLLSTATLVLFAGLVLFKQRAAAAAVALLALLFLYYASYQDDLHRSPRSDTVGGWDVRRGADFLVETVGRVSPPEEGRMGFWYPNWRNGAGLSRLDSVQSAMLWGYSRISPYREGVAGMPEIDATAEERIAAYDRFTLLAESADGLADGRRALTEKFDAEGQEYEWLDSGMFDGEVWDYYYAIVAKRSALERSDMMVETALGSLDVSRMVTSYWPEAEADMRPDGALHLTGVPSQGAYSAIITIPDEIRQPGPARIRVRLSMRSGAFQVAASAPNNANDHRAGPEAVPVQEGPVSVELDVEDMDQPMAVLFINAARHASVADIHSIEIFHLHPPEKD